MSITRKILSVICIVIITCFPVLVQAKTIDLKSSRTYAENNIYYIDAIYDFTLTKEVLNALRHGIPLEIHTLFQLRLKRKWYWDKTISETKLSHRLEHQPLTEDYLTIDLKTGLRRSYDNLEAALKNISTISRLSLFNQSLLQKDDKYIGRIRTYLDLGSLPSPMRPQVYFSEKWDMDSKWYEWKLKQ